MNPREVRERWSKRSLGCLRVRHSSEPGRAFPPEESNLSKKKGTQRDEQKQSKSGGTGCAPGQFRGSDPGGARSGNSARRERVALGELEKWAQRHTSAADVLVLEASGNAFMVAERLRAIERQVMILDSHQAGKVGKVYCANDRVDAVKIARIYLSGLSAIVWQPDSKTLERREVFSAYQAVVKELTRLQKWGLGRSVPARTQQSRGRGRAQTLRRGLARPERSRHRNDRAHGHLAHQAGQTGH